MLRYTGVQTFKFAMKRFEAEKKMWADFFTEISVNYCGTRYVEYALLVEGLE